ncbi:hypothetical protein M0802_005682 [Mischocyttarus mexicanus]|nr:hypothetical protein M0802_005682 [Mischocyttarus mexicanus]
MDIRIHVQDLDQEKSVIHLMPCKINFDGPANVSSFFQSCIQETDNENCSISFRGRPLQGKKIQIPKDYKGIIFFEHKKPAFEDIKRNLYSNSFFSEFTYWNYDKIPSKNDALAKALDWIDIAEAKTLSMDIRIHVQDLDQEKSVIHLMPCKINFDGPANVSSFFQSCIQETDNENCSISFRGRPLQGKKIQIPKDYKGIIFFEHKKPAFEDIKRNLYSNSFFSEFTYWNYDKIPSKNDALAKALDWIDIAEALHSTDK